MIPLEEARCIVDQYAPEGARREELAEAIRWAIVQGQIAAKQPPELPASMAGTVVYQILFFIDETLSRLRGADVSEHANALQACRTRVLAMYGIQPIQSEMKRKGVASEVTEKRKAVRA